MTRLLPLFLAACFLLGFSLRDMRAAADSVTITSVAAPDAAPALDAGPVYTSPEQLAVASAPGITITTIGEDLTLATKLWRSGAMGLAIVIGAWLLLSELAARVPALGHGRLAVWIAAAIGGLAILVDGITRGETPNLQMLVAAAGAAFAIAQDPKRPGGKATEASVQRILASARSAADETAGSKLSDRLVARVVVDKPTAVVPPLCANCGQPDPTKIAPVVIPVAGPGVGNKGGAA